MSATTSSQIPIPVRKALTSRIGSVDWDNLKFGEHSTDHMLVVDFADGKWGAPSIVPFGDFTISPNTLALHYGQTIFEGMKAYRMEDGKVQIFRPHKHYERLVRSADRLCMPMISEEMFIAGLRELVTADRDWVPSKEGASLYLRPFMYASGARLLAHASDKYRFAIIASPSGAYYAQPVRVKVEREFVRAAPGGTGYAKCGGNYGGAFYPTKLANEQGYDQVLWTDGRENKFIEESGTMNVFFVIDGELLTPPLSSSILDGVTRDSLLTIARSLNIPVKEAPVAVEDLKKALISGRVNEAFGAGTAAVISPIRTIGIDGEDFDVPVAGAEGISARLKAELNAIRYGIKADPFGWNYLI